MSKSIISVNHLIKNFGEKSALNDISFQVNQGEIFGFLGPSGSGKTTTINILIGKIKATKGIVEIFQNDIQNISLTDQSRIGFVSDDSGYYENLSLYKNLQLYAKIYQFDYEKLDDLLKRVQLYEDRETKAKNLSSGMKQRMLLVRALIKIPKVLFLDEPTSGLDPTTSRVIHELLFDLKKEGVTIFLTTHNMYEVTKLCDNFVLLHQGKIIESGTPKSIIHKYYQDKTVEISYKNDTTKKISFDQLKNLSNEQDIVSIHSLEPTLEEIFIQLTGERLNV